MIEHCEPWTNLTSSILVAEILEDLYPFCCQPVYQIRAGPPKSSFAVARYTRLFLPRNMKNTQNMLRRRRSEWARALKIDGCGRIDTYIET